MTRVTILPIPVSDGDASYCAIAGETQTYGTTAGEALDALTQILNDEQNDTLVIVQNRRPDRFFSLGQQERLNDLMALWRVQRDHGAVLPSDQQEELDRLIEAELFASTIRTAAMLAELGA
jgi:hypothetical protein